MSELNIGDRVEVVECGKNYRAYDEFIEEFAPKFLESYRLRNNPNNGMIGTVEYTGIHPKNHRDLAIIKIDGNIYLIDQNGLRRVSVKFNLQDFKSGKFAVNCETEIESDEFMRYLDGVGIKWSSGASCKEHASFHGKNTSYCCFNTPSNLEWSSSEFYEKRNKPIRKYNTLNFKEDKAMTMQEIESKQREIADQIKILREQPEFTLDGFLRGEFAVKFDDDHGKSMFLGWLNAKSDIVWGISVPLMDFWGDYNIYEVSSGRLYQGLTSSKKTIPFTTSMLSGTQSNKPAELQRLETEQRKLADEMAVLKRDMDRTGYRKPERHEEYYKIAIGCDGSKVKECNFDGYYDYQSFENGNCFPTESEAQRIADMLNYFFLVQKKAREVGGLLGYGHDDNGSGYVLFHSNGAIIETNAYKNTDTPPLQPILTKSCAETLVKDPEVIKAAKLAWGVK